MRVLWTATDPKSGRYAAIERSSDVAELADHFTALRSRGRGYLEVRRPGSEFPLLTLGFQDGQAVIHLFSDAERSSLLLGYGAAGADASVHVPVMDDVAVFDGDVALSVDRAWATVRHFVQAGSPGELYEWREL
ncbi:hypothetical protein ACFZAV_30275 [Streptomyces sp. NPDC008343]|uniref:hypothetical protein n=1 Tax=Streptomyces sp. NPDC008343 TaxID=3364828 RepID=UPI0036E6DC8A